MPRVGEDDRIGTAPFFALDAGARPSLQRVGGRLPVLIVDGFFKDPAAVRAAALRLPYHPPDYPYPGKLGVVQEGALADLVLVDGDPIGNLNLLADPGKNFLVIMKDGKVYKNALR